MSDISINHIVPRALKYSAGVIISLTIIGSAAMLAADTRYAQKSHVIMRIDYATDQLRRATLEDVIYELTQIPEVDRTGSQRARLDRYIRQLNELNSRWVGFNPGNW